MADYRIVIIGAGLAGLTAARRLVGLGPGPGPSATVDPGEILVVDKGRGVGGRLATRRIGGGTLDHGAQFFTVRTEPFQRDVESWTAAGVVEEWCRGFTTVDGYPRYRGAGGMKELARHLGNEVAAAGVEVVTDTRVAGVGPTAEGWDLGYLDGIRPTDRAGSLLVTAPVPQSLELLDAVRDRFDPSVLTALDAVAYHKVLGLLALLDRSPDLPDPGALQRPDDPTFTFVADNRAKEISAEPAVTFHTAHARSAELWDADDDEVIAVLGPPARGLVAPAEIVELQVKRWRYAGPVTPYPGDHAVAVVGTGGRGRLVLAGDGFSTSRVEGAYTSGRAAAQALVTASAE